MEHVAAADVLPLEASVKLRDDVEGFPLLLDEVGGSSGHEDLLADRLNDRDGDQELLQEMGIELDLGLGDLLIGRDSADTQGDGVAATGSTTVQLSAEGPHARLEAAAVAIAPEKVKKKARHKRPKDELDYLRNQVVQLQQELELAQLTSTEALILAPEGASVLSSEELDGEEKEHPASLWERVAKNQKTERMKTEVENLKLRQTLEGQLKIARSLEKLLRKRPAEETLDQRDQRTQLRKLANVQEADIFGILSERVDALFLDVDAVMREMGFATERRERNDAEVKFDSLGRVCLELVDAKIVPFKLHDVSEAVWATANTERVQLPNGYYGAVDNTEDTVRSEFCATMRLRRTEVLVRMHLLMKRVVEEHRVLLVWATIGRTEGAAFRVPHVNISESAWTVLEDMGRDQPGANGVVGPSTIMQSCIRLTPELDGLAQRNSQIGLLTDLMVGSYALNLKTLHQTIENQLLQAAFG